MRGGCDTTAPRAQLTHPELMSVATDHKLLDADEAKLKTVYDIGWSL